MCKSLSLDEARARHVLALSDKLFGETGHLHGLTKTCRPLLHAAAVLGAAGAHRGPRGRGSVLSGASLSSALSDLSASERRIVARSVALCARCAGAGKRAPAGRRDAEGFVDQVAGRIAAIVGIASALDADGSDDTAIAGVADDGTALEVFVGGGERGRVNAAAAAEKLAPWNALMLRPIRSVGAADGEAKGGALVRPDERVVEAARRILQRHLEQFLARTYGLACRQDIEYVHEMRVALRRFRAAMRAFGGALQGLPPELKGEVRFFARELGGVRDLDVFMAFLKGYVDRAPEAQVPFLRQLLGSVRRRRSARYRALVATFRSGRYEAFKDRYYPLLMADGEGGTGLRPRGRKGRRPIRAAAPPMLQKRLDKVLKYTRRPDRYPPQKQHALRIECKKFRYTAEFFSDIYPGGLREILVPMMRMQEALGEVHDAAVYGERIEGYLRRSRRGKEARMHEAARALLGHLHEVRGRALARAARLWRAFRRRKARTGVEKLIRAPRHTNEG